MPDLAALASRDSDPKEQSLRLEQQGLDLERLGLALREEEPGPEERLALEQVRLVP